MLPQQSLLESTSMATTLVAMEASELLKMTI